MASGQPGGRDDKDGGGNANNDEDDDKDDDEDVDEDDDKGVTWCAPSTRPSWTKTPFLASRGR